MVFILVFLRWIAVVVSSSTPVGEAKRKDTFELVEPIGNEMETIREHNRVGESLIC